MDDEGKIYIEIASSSARRMQELVDDLLEYARIGDVGENMESLNCADSLVYVKNNLQEQISEASTCVEFEGKTEWVFANPVRFSRVLQNLVSNSIKYSASGVEPQIRVGVQVQSGQWLVTVRDNGIGMKQEYCERIFLPFKRLHGQSEYSGSGMGLAICRKIIESAGGKIWATSNIGESSVFYFTIPRFPVEIEQQFEEAA